MFKLDLTGTTPGREVRAGVTTFATMAYIVAVNPLILADAGMPREAVVAALRERHNDYYDEEVRDRIDRVAGHSLRPAVSDMLHGMVQVHAQDVSLHGALRGQPHTLDPERETEFKRMLLEHFQENAAELRPMPDPELTAFIVIRALEFMIHGVALEEPDRLKNPHYADELTELLVRFLGAIDD